MVIDKGKCPLHTNCDGQLRALLRTLLNYDLYSCYDRNVGCPNNQNTCWKWFMLKKQPPRNGNTKVLDFHGTISSYDGIMLYDFTQLPNKSTIAFCFVIQALLDEHDYNSVSWTSVVCISYVHIDTSLFTNILHNAYSCHPNILGSQGPLHFLISHNSSPSLFCHTNIS